MARSHRFAVAAAAATLALNLSAHAFLLQNPGLNAGPDFNSADFWTLIEPDTTATGMPVDSANFQGFANHEAAGTRGLWFKSFEGGINDDAPDTVNAILYQDVPATPGTDYTLSAWFKYETGYNGQNNLFIEFLDAADGVITLANLEVDALQTNDNTWRQFMINAVAPAGTVTARVGANMLDGMNSQMNPQSAFVDDFILIPAPGAAAMLLGMGGIVSQRKRSIK